MPRTADLIDVNTPAGPMPAHRWLPERQHGPGIVVVQEIFGVSSYIQQRAADLAGQGYVVLAPELYWRLPQASVDESDPDVLTHAMELAGQVQWAEAVADTRAALAALRCDPQLRGGVGLVGFCFGGGVAFQAAAQDAPDALVSYYGSALPALLDHAPQVRCPSLHHFGTADEYIPMDQVQAIRQAVTSTSTPAQFELYDGAGHAFDNPAEAFHHAAASARAWPRTLEFLATHLPVR